MNSLFSLSGKRILVTGASGGLGRAIAVVASEAGATVVVHGRNETRCRETINLLKGTGHRVEAGDLLREDISVWMKRLVAEAGPLDGFVHAAGIQAVRPVRVLDDRIFNETMQVNAGMALALTRAFRQRGVCREKGSVVWLASVMALAGQPGQAAYSASKGALVSMCRSVALELARERIRVNCVAPGLVEAGMGESLKSTLSPEQYAAVSAMHPLGLGQAADVAGPVVFLLSDAAAWITGTTLVVDGGYCAH